MVGQYLSTTFYKKTLSYLIYLMGVSLELSIVNLNNGRIEVTLLYNKREGK